MYFALYAFFSCGAQPDLFCLNATDYWLKTGNSCIFSESAGGLQFGAWPWETMKMWSHRSLINHLHLLHRWADKLCGVLFLKTRITKNWLCCSEIRKNHCLMLVKFLSDNWLNWFIDRIRAIFLCILIGQLCRLPTLCSQLVICFPYKLSNKNSL